MMRSNEGRPWRSTCEATVASPIFGSKSCLAHDCPFSCDRDDCPNECCSNDRSGAWPANFRCRAPGRHCDSRLMDPTCAERCVANHRLQRHRDSWIEILQEHQNHMHRHRAHQWCQLLDHGSSGDSGGEGPPSGPVSAVPTTHQNSRAPSVVGQPSKMQLEPFKPCPHRPEPCELDFRHQSHRLRSQGRAI